jgi:Flp pilus assembly pilin Flp
MYQLLQLVDRAARHGRGVTERRRGEDGQTLVEYALVLVLIAIVVAVVVTTLGVHIKSVFGSITDAL